MKKPGHNGRKPSANPFNTYVACRACVAADTHEWTLTLNYLWQKNYLLLQQKTQHMRTKKKQVSCKNEERVWAETGSFFINEWIIFIWRWYIIYRNKLFVYSIKKTNWIFSKLLHVSVINLQIGRIFSRSRDCRQYLKLISTASSTRSWEKWSWPTDRQRSDPRLNFFLSMYGSLKSD